MMFVLYWNNEIEYCNNGSFTSEMSKTLRISSTGICPVSRLDLLHFTVVKGPLVTLICSQLMFYKSVLTGLSRILRELL